VVYTQAPHASRPETCADQSGRSGGSRYSIMNIHEHGDTSFVDVDRTSRSASPGAQLYSG